MTDHGIHAERGWVGVFTRQQSPLALFKNGQRVQKTASEKGDTHAEGAQGVVLGSLGGEAVGGFPAGTIAYFVEWDDLPKHAVAVMEWKLRPVS